MGAAGAIKGPAYAGAAYRATRGAAGRMAGAAKGAGAIRGAAAYRAKSGAAGATIGAAIAGAAWTKGAA